MKNNIFHEILFWIFLFFTVTIILPLILIIAGILGIIEYISVVYFKKSTY